jgi:hypothetical protein
MKSQRMKRLEELFLVKTDPVRLFLTLVCIIGVSPIGVKTQPRTTHQLYDIFAKATKLFYRHLAVELNFAYDDDGTRLTDHQLFMRCRLLTFKDFKDAVDEYVGAAHYGNRPSGKSYGYPNLVVKDILIYWLHSPEVRSLFKSFDALVETMDRIQTVEDSMASVQGFRAFAEPFIAKSLDTISEKQVVALQSANDTTLLAFLMHILNQDGTTRAELQ